MEVLDTHGKDRRMFRLLCKMHMKHTYESALIIGLLPYLKLLLIFIGTVLKFLTQAILLLLTTTRINTAH